MAEKANPKEFTAHFRKLDRESVSQAGGKGAQLSEIFNAGIPVPEGFVVLTDSFDAFLGHHTLEDKIFDLIDACNPKKPATIKKASKSIQAMIMKGKMPLHIEQFVFKDFDKLKAEYVAVRSSATAEDASNASWAGELDTYTNITRKDLIENVKKCWASLFTERAIFYRIEKNMKHEHVSVAVVVQKMVQSEVSGVAFTVHPITQDRNKMVIEAGLGLGESVVAGKITPDNYIIDKKEGIIDEVTIGKQLTMISRKQGKSLEYTVPLKDQEKQKLHGKHILELAKICMHIEKHYGHPQDIEWALEKNKLYIVQTRPITTLSK